MKIKIKCPAKINLDLKVFPINPDGYHPIKSIMQTINLFDYLTISISKGDSIKLSGNSNEIPYDEKNICFKAAKLFLETIEKKYKVEIYIEKNIPVCAGLAGGSTDAAGVLYGLNKLLNEPLNKKQIHNLASKLGSDLNFCLVGGRQLCEGRGEILTKQEFADFPLTLVKPKKLQISAKEAYIAFDNLKEKPTMPNYLEFALLNKYSELQFLNSKDLQMSGSGPTYFIQKEKLDFELNEDYQIIENLKAINFGVIEII
ncbi:MAG: 4-(cytidine 5'-diphospho)-2-C-methyl-D-erythritol kinase [Candidatus Gastranaerophilales bacterium]|nr:4-(cytidine 5'-diphospho)-2-C-methyl-D-erythritol kinase [Candidatus Gastranaerophilales bacterium]